MRTQEIHHVNICCLRASIYNGSARPKNVNLTGNVRLRSPSIAQILPASGSQTPYHPNTGQHRLTIRVLGRASPPTNTDHGCPSALQRRLLPLALPTIGTRSHHILAGFPWLHLRTDLEIVEGASQVRHPVHRRNFLSVSASRTHITLDWIY
jgi:hypothetical protein